MARLTNKDFDDYQNQVEMLQEAYESFRKKKPTPVRIAALAQDEEDFVNQGLIPYLKQIIESATDLLQVPISISIEHESGKPVQIKAMTKSKPAAPTQAAAPKPSTTVNSMTAALAPIIYAPKPTPAPKTTPAPTPVAQKPAHTFAFNSKSASKAPPTGLRVNIGNGNVIHEFYAADTFTQAIAYAFDKVGIEKVVSTVTRYEMVLDGDYLVKRGTFSNPMANSHLIGKGYYTNTHSNNETKKRLLENLFNRLGLHCSVTILKSR